MKITLLLTFSRLPLPYSEPPSLGTAAITINPISKYIIASTKPTQTPKLTLQIKFTLSEDQSTGALNIIGQYPPGRMQRRSGCMLSHANRLLR